MKRVFKILAVMLLGVFLTVVVLAFTILRPRSQEFSPTFEVGYVDNGISMRKRIQVTRTWEVYSLREWDFFTFVPISHSIAPAHGWQFGPFYFEEERRYTYWPVAVEKAARAIAVQKLNLKDPALVKEPELRIYEHASDPISWVAVISSPGGKRQDLFFDKQGKLLPGDPDPPVFGAGRSPSRNCTPPRTRGLFRW